MAGVHKEVIGGITRADIEKVKKKVKIGDRLRVQTLKAADPESMNSRYYGVERRAVVVAKYPNFAVVELSKGVQEAIPWTDLIKRKERVAK